SPAQRPAGGKENGHPMRAALRNLFLAVVTLTAAACATTAGTAGPGEARQPERMRTPPPSRATIEFIGYDQAVALASGYALGTGDLLRVVRAEREGDTWTVDVDVQGLLA